MKVITLDNNLFYVHCRRLEDLVDEDYQPDAIVGIVDGGAFVADQVFKKKPHINVTCRRKSTKQKEKLGFLFRIIRHLPEGVRNAMRVIEAKLLSMSKKDELKHVDLNHADFASFKNILIVDDAVDSGLTMKSVVTALKALPHAPKIRTAVITTTTDNPLIRPDYTLYNDGTLIRFPWSSDNAK